MSEEKEKEEQITEQLKNLKERIKNQSDTIDQFIDNFNEAIERQYSEVRLYGSFISLVKGTLKNTQIMIGKIDENLEEWAKIRRGLTS